MLFFGFKLWRIPRNNRLDPLRLASLLRIENSSTVSWVPITGLPTYRQVRTPRLDLAESIYLVIQFSVSLRCPQHIGGMMSCKARDGYWGRGTPPPLHTSWVPHTCNWGQGVRYLTRRLETVFFYNEDHTKEQVLHIPEFVGFFLAMRWRNYCICPGETVFFFSSPIFSPPV